MTWGKLDLLGPTTAGDLERGDVLVSHCFDPVGHDCEGWHERFVVSLSVHDQAVAALTLDEWGRVHDEPFDAEGMVHVLQPRFAKMCKPRSQRNEGAVAVCVALMMVVVLPILGLLLTRGLAAVIHNRLQVAADSAALDAAGSMVAEGRLDTATLAAESIAGSNADIQPGEWATCIDVRAYAVTVTTSCISFDMAMDRIRVVAPRRRVPMLFGWVAGLPNELPTSAIAEATWAGGQVHLVR